MISVIVPAHNEERVIGRCLAGMVHGATPGELEVIVVCNGCSDGTAEIARSFGPQVTVLDRTAAGKPGALNAGDAQATGFPRIYVDADVTLTAADLRAVGAYLDQPGALAAAPRLRLDLSRSSWAIRAYYSIWERLPYVTKGMIGSGVFGLSSAGRSRFADFPDVIADDFFVASRFTDAERATVETATFTVYPATRAKDLIRRKTRAFAGLRQLRALGLTAPTEGSSTTWLRIAVHERLIAAILPYAVITVAAKLMAAWKTSRGDMLRWERDDSSREAVEGIDGGSSRVAGPAATRNISSAGQNDEKVSGP